MNPLDTIPVLVGLPISALVGLYAIYRAARFVMAIIRGPYERPKVTRADNCGPCSGGQPFTGTYRGTITAHQAAAVDFDQELEQAWQRVEVRENEHSQAKRG